MPTLTSRRRLVSPVWREWRRSATRISLRRFAIRLSPNVARITRSVGSKRSVYPDSVDDAAWIGGDESSASRNAGLMVVMVREGLQESGFESFVAGVSPRPEELRVIYNAPHGAGVVHA